MEHRCRQGSTDGTSVSLLLRPAADPGVPHLVRSADPSPLTAKTHVNRMMPKLGARDRAQLVVIAYETGLVRPGLS
jgi:hypothetical protein